MKLRSETQGMGVSDRQERHLVTGGGGYVGVKLGQALVELGHDVVLFDVCDTPEDLPEGCTFVKGDIRNADDIRKAMKDVDCLYHLASYGMSGREQFCLAIRYLATGANYAALSQTQGVSKSSVTRSLDHVLEYFYHSVQKFIKFPENPLELLQTAVEWEAFHHAPRCIGVMDGTHIAIKKPAYVDEAPYVNRKGWHSVNAMVICDSQKRIIHMSPVFPGCSADAYVYSMSELRTLSENGILGDYYFLADSGYRVTRNVYTPVDHPDMDAQDAYNAWHRSTRSIVERCIGLWKQRWRCLDSSAGYLYHEPQRVAKILIATACLHNLCIDAGIPVQHDNDPDGYRPIMMPLQQPRQRRQAALNPQARTDFINNFFA